MQQKIIQVGNSIGIIIPQTLAKNSLKPGDVVNIEKDKSGEAYTFSKGKISTSSITPHFFSVLDRVNRQYGKALKEIAER